MKTIPGIFRRIVRDGLLVTTAVFSSVALASSGGSYLGRQDVNKFIDDMVTEHHFDRSKLEAVIGKAERSQRAIELISRPAEGTMEWKDYRKIFLTPERITKGVRFWEENSESLAAAEKKWGVPAHIIVAIIGVETYYGRQTGGFRVLDTLTTLGFDYPPRQTFFRKELENFLILARDQKLDVEELTGSYAGAMGIPQFMPSSYRAYAVDYTGDEQANIWFSEEDAIGSVANYLKKHGWKYGKGVAVQTRVSGVGVDDVLSDGLKPDQTLAEVQDSGWQITSTGSDALKVLPMKHEGSAGAEYWLGMHNFYVITRYNRSQMYALAVYQLAKEVRAGYNSSVALKSKAPEGKL
ncbi:lytic murein transglycosylase B [uncultured Endozoicomonas sp.]|uniref:lytic murein transglycosylase B n=1 Tax=uncultured Endozoicomonas sp. TaxID=432652 RepID=UPI0026030CB1|nr:lytic murein transglycosylase B [uncultured Endozoicomonas sp.]